MKKPWWRFPEDLSPSGAWANAIWTLCLRYNQNNAQRPTPYCWIDAIEPLNEANATYFPQMTSTTDSNPYHTAGASTVAGCQSARMMVTTKSIVDSLGGHPLIVAPSLLDIAGASSDRLGTGYTTYTNDVLNYLSSVNFTPGPNFIWSVHNYGDVAHQDNRIGAMRQLLVGKWAGWPFSNASSPSPWATEGGLLMFERSTTNRLHYESEQRDLLNSMWTRTHNDTIGQGAGYSLVTQYTFNVDFDYDSALREPSSWNPPGAPRLAYYGAWNTFPQYP